MLIYQLNVFSPIILIVENNTKYKKYTKEFMECRFQKVNGEIYNACESSHYALYKMVEASSGIRQTWLRTITCLDRAVLRRLLSARRRAGILVHSRF
jgi:hypothetical protein